MGAGSLPPVGLLVTLDLAVSAPKSNGILPVCEVALAVNLISVEDSLFVTLSGDDALGNSGAEEVHQAVFLGLGHFGGNFHDAHSLDELDSHFDVVCCCHSGRCLIG